MIYRCCPASMLIANVNTRSCKLPMFVNLKSSDLSRLSELDGELKMLVSHIV